ncbi:zinc finger protein 62 homolog isoform X9 [Achroia grisella]|uniref:zinc finger protein 62 homolog isoform X9 n=1 Tax=Achroia grisella TaxID=688607 RepID=UPI0027D32729|nr:zinc finger protein 62 homolog isoform X9 [Achroia grisella]
MDTTMNHGMCRCCASEGTFKNLSNAYQWMGQEEIYSDMLKECFDISLTTAEPGEEGGICEVCITQLRNAANFKKQVQHTEVQFKKCLQDKLFKSDLIKVEATNLDDGDDSDNDNNLSDNFSGNEFDMAIKKEKEDPKPKKRVATRASTSRAKKSKVDDGEPSTKRIRRNVLVIGKSETSKNLKTNLKQTKICDIEMKMSELEKQRANIRMILQYSNATPIRCRGGIGYACSFCANEYPNAADLKMHTLESHDDKTKLKFMKEKMMSSFLVKLDITQLKCTICEANIDSLEQITDHLISVHDKRMFTDIKNHIMSFKFDDEYLRCIICRTTFNKFKALQEHMNVHYRNYICDVCDAGFLNRSILLHHKETHKIGTFKCDYCSKIFDTRRKQKSHEKSVHITSNLLNKCGYCNEKFKDYRKKDDHIAKVHGVRLLARKCQACDKTFVNQTAFTIHTKRDHLMERRHNCPQCDMKFFSSSELRDHLVKHTGERQFECNVCHKSYGRKKTLREHMRIHVNDRRFKCEYCGLTFVQKCSWKGHVRSKHGDLVQ